MADQLVHGAFGGRRSVRSRLIQLDQSKSARFLAVVILFAPLIIATKWFAVIHGTFVYDDFDMLSIARTTPLAKAIFLIHGDVPLPLFRAFVSGMYALFGVNELYWNLYFLFLTVAVNLAALALLIVLGANFVVASVFFLTTISASVWSFTALGYYSMSIYPQIGLLGLVGAIAIVLWRTGGSANYKWVAVGASVAAPFIHPSGAYVPLMLGVFTFVSELGRTGVSWSPFRMLNPEFRWFTLGLAATVIGFGLFFAFELRNNQFLSMAHSPLSASAVLRSMYFLFSQGAALELFRPMIRPFLRYSTSAAQGIAATILALVFVAASLRVSARQRWMFLALLANSLVVITVVSFGRRLNSIDDVVGSAGKYSNFAYLWFSIAIFYLVACLAPKIPRRWRPTSGAVALACAGMLFVGYAREPNIYLPEMAQRLQQRHDLVGIFADYASKTAPAPVHIPNLDGVFIYPEYQALYKYNLSSYEPFFQGFGDRVTVLRNSAMSSWGMEATQTVESLRRSVDPAFIQRLETDRKLQSLYFDGIELNPLDQMQSGGAPATLDGLAVSNATRHPTSAGSLSFSTDGSASVVLFPGDWDPEQRHVLTMRVDATYPIPNPQTKIDLLFEGELPIPYSVNKIVLPAEGGEISLDLLQLYSYSLNPRVGKLTLRFPAAGTYTISGVRLTP
jgi:hypothetical protein